ncbi:MAG: chloride channel protein [Planctomycetota bacterium]
MIRKPIQLVRRAHANLRQVEHVYMVLVALLIGLGGGLAAVGFRRLIELGNWISWQDKNYTLSQINNLPAAWKICVPAIGGLLCALIVYYFAREAKGHGVPEVMEAVALKNGRIRPRVVLAKMFASAISISSGGSVGREGPIVQIGSAFGSSIGQWLKVDERRLRTLVGCGAAAGIAATFNAPVAGALFAAEVILADFGVAQFSPIVISSVAATVVGHYFFGDVPAFVIEKYTVVHPNELFAYAFLGILAGLAAIAFVRVLYITEDLFDKVKVWPPAKAIVGGAVIGVIALWFPQIFGVGYEAIEQALSGVMAWHLLLILVLIKIVAVSITIGSGGSGGIFAPSLFIGAMAGGAVGTVIHGIWPDSTAPPGAYAVVGMAAVVGATTHAPITAIVIIFELTGDYKLMLPLMVCCIIATLLASQLLPGSIYTLKLLRRGVDIHKGQDVSVLKHLLVRDEMRPQAVTVRAGAGLLTVISELIEHRGNSLFVVDDHHKLLGVITADQSRALMADAPSFEAFIIAQDMMQETDFPTVNPDDSLADVMKRLARYRGEVPVLEHGRLVGVMWPEDVLERYNAELFKRDMASNMAATVSRGVRAEPIPAIANTSMLEIPVPPAFIGHSVGSLDIRNRYHSTILLIKQRASIGEDIVNASPSANYIFQPGDVLLVMGPDENLRRLERGDTYLA